MEGIIDNLGIGNIHNVGGDVCYDNHHVYPKSYAGNPEYAAAFFSRCLCGKKRKITTVTEVDITFFPLDTKDKNAPN